MAFPTIVMEVGMSEPRKQTVAEALQKLGKLLKDANESPPASVPTGACVYSGGEHTYCADGLTQADCNSLGGIWTKGGHCPSH
jgi:hypothetical protein